MTPSLDRYCHEARHIQDRYQAIDDVMVLPKEERETLVNRAGNRAGDCVGGMSFDV